MLPTLENSEKFKREFTQFKTRIEKITDETVKAELSSKLSSLLREVRSVDTQSHGMFMGNQMPNRISDSRTTLGDLRKYITSRLNEWDQRQRKKQ